jgi:hypothetical protein
MLIVCTIKRKLGSHTKMPDDGTVYSFLPNEHGDHVAEVVNLDHIQRLLAIETYKPYGVAAAVEAEASVAADNELTELEQAIKPELVTDLAQMTMEELLAEYHYRFGRAAPKLIKYDTLLQKLAAARMDASAQE